MKSVFKITYVVLMAAFVIGVSGAYADQWSRGYPNTMSSCNDCNECCSENFWVSADFIYLTTCEDGFGCSFGSTDITSTVSAGSVITNINEKDRDIDFDWNPGFRVGVGYNIPCSCWDAGVYWTNLYEKGRGHDCDNHAKWTLRFNEVDALLGYNMTCCNCFDFKPFFGARYAKINQSLSTHLESTILIVATGASSIVTTTHNDTEHFWGGGPVVGFEGNFSLGCGFSVYGDVAGSLLYGRFNNKFNDSDVFTAATNNCLSSKENCGVLYGLDAGLGVRYEMCYVTLQLGLEQHTYFDYNQIGCGGDLNLYGVNASLNFRF